MRIYNWSAAARLTVAITLALGITSAARAQDRFFVGEKGSKQVHKYTPAFVATTNWGASQSVSPANGAPDDVSVTDQHTYVLDSSAKRVYRYAYTGGTPSVSRQLRLTAGTTAIATPYGMAVDSTGNEMWVATDAKVLYRYNLTTAFSSGTGVNAGNAYTFGTVSSQTNDKVGGLAIDATYAYVLDNEDSRLYRYSRATGAISAVSRQMRNSAGTAWTKLEGVAILGTDVYVVNNDSANTVIKYSLTNLFTDTTTENAAVGNSWTLPVAANTDPYGIGINPFPSVSSIVRAATNPTAAASVTFTVTFSESVTGVDIADFGLTTTGDIAGASVTSLTGSGSTRTVTVNTGTGSGTIRLDFADNDTVLDIGSLPVGGTGDNGDYATGEVYTIDRAAPSVTVITPSTTGPTNADSIAFTVTFGESVTGFDSTDLIVAHSGTSHTGAGITGSGASYTVTVNGVDGDGTFTLGISTGSGVLDTVGNALASSVTSAEVSIDNTAPSAVSVTPSLTGPTNTDSMSFAVVFDGPVSNFSDAADLTIAHDGTSHTTTTVTGSGDTYTVTLEGIEGDGSFTAAVNTASDVQDAAGNIVASSPTSDDVLIDNTAPLVTSVTASTTGPTNADIITFDVVFDGMVSNFDEDADVVITHNGTSHTTASISGDGTTFTVTVEGIAGDGFFTAAVNLGSNVQDAAGNAAAAGNPESEPVAIDMTAPQLDSISPESASAIVVTFADAGGMGSAALLPSSYTASGPGLGSLSPMPDTVEYLGGNSYRLLWNSGGSVNGQTLNIDVDPAVADNAGNSMDTSDTSASTIALPVSLSGFAIE